ncbi:MAG: Dam family site-specific DNA-(adenine-N6)-methyltransferase [Thermodesulfobacteriota bacterium]
MAQNLLKIEKLNQLSFFDNRPKGQLLKWIGSKYKYAHIIVSYFPSTYNKFIEPFVGTGAVLATLSPQIGIAGDTLKPLIEIWNLLQNNHKSLIDYYTLVINDFYKDRDKIYYEIRDKYNSSPNGLDLLILSRTCYGGVVRFTNEGKMSTPIGPHNPISPQAFASRVKEWRERVKGTRFLFQSFIETMSLSNDGDLIYCDPPYIESQSILYGAQRFKFERLVEEIKRCKERGAKIALSIDGKKKSGKKIVELNIPPGVFKREVFLSCGSSMLRRLQVNGKMIGEDVQDRLLLTW